MTTTERLPAKYDGSCDQLAVVLAKLVGRYGEDDAIVLACSRALARRQKAVSHLGERLARAA